MKKPTLLAAAITATFSIGSFAADSTDFISKQWTYKHEGAGQISEIPAFDHKTNTIWVAGVVGVDVINAETGDKLEHIDVTPYGYVNSVAIHNGLAAFAIEAKSNPNDATQGDRRNLGKVVFYDTKTREYINDVTVGSLPDMLTFTHDGSKLLVANEGTPNFAADKAYSSPDPEGSVSIIDVATRSVIASPGFSGVPTSGENLRTNTGMDFEPEYITIDEDDNQAYVTLQEANAMAVLDLTTNEFTQVIGLGAKDFSLPGNQIDPLNNSNVSFISPVAKGLYMPDGIASYQWHDNTYIVMANEGDFREDNVDRSAANTFGAVSPLSNLRVSNKDSSAGNLYAAGARSFSIRDANGNLVYDSGDILDKEANARGIYDDGRSRDKGVEPEGVALLDIAGRNYAFIGLERTTKSAVAIFDITAPAEASFVDMIVTEGDVSPEGLAAYRYRGNFYLAIANEVSNSTTLYLIDKILPKSVN